MDHQSLALAVRWLHVAAMATAFGGAILVTWLTWRGPADRIADIAIRYGSCSGAPRASSS
ncbi:MAG: hypothetical protein M3P16_02970 [Chloroflexota bacterium]|nr:hypothetical protein [Chloroflexota bacterium]